MQTHKHVMTFGTFDLFHPGHVYYLTEAQKFGEKMTIVIARDTRVTQKKGKNPIHNELRRQKNVVQVFSDANVVLGDESDIFTPIREYKPDVLVFGYDQEVPMEMISREFPEIIIASCGAHEPEKWKSSLLRMHYEK